MLGALMASIIDNNREQIEDIELVIMDTGLSPKSRADLAAIARRAGLSFRLEAVTSQTFQDKFGLDAPNINLYARMLAAHLVDESVERVLFIDADIICLRQIPSLQSIDLGGGFIAAARDPMNYFRHGIANHREFGFTGEEPYFNAGVMIINAPKWRAGNISQRSIELSSQYDFAHFDQTALNILLHGQWESLDRSWNELDERQPDRTIFRHFALAKPIHYHRPTIDSQEIFLKYLDMTPWKGWRPKPRWRILLEAQLLRVLRPVARNRALFI